VVVPAIEVGTVRNDSEPTRFYSRMQCEKFSGMGGRRVRTCNEGAASAMRCLAYPFLGNLCVVKDDRSN
jgi:hypothetical protein